MCRKYTTTGIICCLTVICTPRIGRATSRCIINPTYRCIRHLIHAHLHIFYLKKKYDVVYPEYTIYSTSSQAVKSITIRLIYDIL